MGDDDGERFEIEYIVDKRYRKDQVEYLIKWRGYPDSQNTWEPCKSSTSFERVTSPGSFLANNIEGEQESELLAEYENFTKQQKPFNSGSRASFNNSSPSKRRTVRPAVLNDEST